METTLGDRSHPTTRSPAALVAALRPCARVHAAAPASGVRPSASDDSRRMHVRQCVCMSCVPQRSLALGLGARRWVPLLHYIACLHQKTKPASRARTRPSAARWRLAAPAAPLGVLPTTKTPPSNLHANTVPSPEPSRTRLEFSTGGRARGGCRVATRDRTHRHPCPTCMSI